MSNITAWAIAVAITVIVGACATHNDAKAYRQDVEAIHSRNFAGQKVCGLHATPEWLDDRTLQCLRHIDAPVTADTDRTAPTVLAKAAR